MIVAVESVAAQEAPAAGSDAPVAVERIVVTAQKRQERLEDVPASISVLREPLLQKKRVHSLLELSQSVPNFEVTTASGMAALNIRGVGGGGRNIGFDTRVGVYLDGIYVGQSQALGQSLFDLEQIEVLRGPQGHLFGRNSVAGAVVITTRTPSKDTESSLRAGAGYYGLRELHGVLSGSLGDQWAGRISVASESRGGYTKNLYSGERLDDLDRLGMRAQLRYQSHTELTFNLFGDYSHSRQKALVGEATSSFADQPLPNGPLSARVVNVNTQPYLSAEVAGLSATANYALDKGNTFTSVTGYRFTRQERRNDSDYTPLDIFAIRYSDGFHQYSQELRLSSPNAGTMRYLAGIYLLRESAQTRRLAATSVDAPLLRLPPDVVATNAGSVSTSSAAVFGSLDIDLVEWLALNLGARFTRERKRLVYSLSGAANFGFATLDDYRDAVSEQKLTPTVGVSFGAARDLLVYAKFATGFKSGGWNADFLTDAQVQSGFRFSPETVKSFEVGMKGALSRNIRYELALFEARYHNYQVFYFARAPNGTAILQLKNAAKVESRGMEASVHGAVISGLNVSAGAGLTKAVYRDFPNGGGLGVDLSGSKVPDSPRFTANLSFDYRIPMEIMGGAFDVFVDFNHRDGALQEQNLPALGSRDLVSLRFTFSKSNSAWSASAWLRNATNRNYAVAAARDFLGVNVLTRGAPRTFGAEVRADF